MTWLVKLPPEYCKIGYNNLLRRNCLSHNAVSAKARDVQLLFFAVQQLVEKTWEHRTKAFILFIDLRKAYDSVPHRAMWLALAKLGVPSSTIQLIQSFHRDKQATIQLGGTLLGPITANNGLRQGCCMAPVLFNLYACLFVEHWTERVADTAGVGVNVKYKYDLKLFRRYTCNADEARFTDLQFADDAALLATTRAGAEGALYMYIDIAADFGLSVNVSKTKLMVTGRKATADDRVPIPVGDDRIESVNEFQYLGSVIASSGRMLPNIDQRIAKASRACGALHKSVFNSRDLRVETKCMVYQACVLSVLLYGSECWTPLRKDLKKLDSFNHRCIRTILGISNQQQWAQHITSQSVRQQWETVKQQQKRSLNAGWSGLAT